MSERAGKFTETVIVVAGLMIIFASIKSSVDLLVPFLLALFIAIICNPLVKFMVRYRIPRLVAVLLVLTLIVLIGMSLASIVTGSMREFTSNMPQVRAQVTAYYTSLADNLTRFNIFIDKAQLLELFDPGSAMSVATNMLSGLGAVMTNVFLILLTTIFMLFEAPDLPKKAHLALSDPEMKMANVDRFLASVNSYLAIKTAISAITGLIIGLLMWMIGLKYFVLFGVVAFLLNYIPTIGSIIAAIPAVLLALIQFGPTTAGLVGLCFFAVNIIMGSVLEPKIMGRGLGISTLVVFLSLVFWGWLLGSVGMLLSVPLTIVVKIALESSSRGRRFAYLLGDVVDPVEPEPAEEIKESEAKPADA